MPRMAPKSHRRFLPVRLAVLGATLVGLAACSSGTGPTGGGGGGGGRVSITVSPTSVGIARGAAADVTVALTRTGFSGPVTLSAPELPAGITAQFYPQEMSGAGTAAVLTIAVSESAAVGSHSMTVEANGSGVAEATAGLSVEVTIAPD